MQMWNRTLHFTTDYFALWTLRINMNNTYDKNDVCNHQDTPQATFGKPHFARWAKLRQRTAKKSRIFNRDQQDYMQLIEDPTCWCTVWYVPRFGLASATRIQWQLTHMYSTTSGNCTSSRKPARMEYWFILDQVRLFWVSEYHHDFFLLCFMLE